MKKISHLALPVLAIALLTGASAAYATSSTEVENELNGVRQARQLFKESRAAEVTARQEATKERVQTRMKAAEEKREAAQKKRDQQRATVLVRLIDLHIKHLTNTKERVNKMPNIEAAQKTQLSAEIDRMVAELIAKKTQVQSATTPEQLKQLAEELRASLKSYHETVAKIVAAIHASHTTSLVSKAENRVAEIKAKIAELKAAGKDVSALETALQQAEQKIAAATTQTGQQELKEALKSLKEAYELFRTIASQAKGL